MIKSYNGEEYSPELTEFFLRFILTGRNRHKFGETNKIFLLQIPTTDTGMTDIKIKKIVSDLKLLNPELKSRKIYAKFIERGNEYHRFSFMSRDVWIKMKTIYGFTYNSYSREFRLFGYIKDYNPDYIKLILGTLFGIKGLDFQSKSDIVAFVKDALMSLYGPNAEPQIVLKRNGANIRVGDKYQLTLTPNVLMEIVEIFLFCWNTTIVDSCRALILKEINSSEDVLVPSLFGNKVKVDKNKAIILGKFIGGTLTPSIYTSTATKVEQIPVRVVPKVIENVDLSVVRPISIEPDALGGHEKPVSGTDEAESIFSSRFPMTDADKFLSESDDRSKSDGEMIVNSYVETFDERMKRAIIMPMERIIPIDMNQEKNYREGRTDKTYYSYDPTWSVHRFWMDEMHSVDGSFSDHRRIAMEDDALSRWDWDRDDYKYLYLYSEFPYSLSIGERKSAKEHIAELKRMGKYFKKMLPYWKAKGMAIPDPSEFDNVDGFDEESGEYEVNEF